LAVTSVLLCGAPGARGESAGTDSSTEVSPAAPAETPGPAASQTLTNPAPSEGTAGVPAAIAARPVLPQGAPPDRITLDIKGMDIVEVLKILASRAGMNMIVGKSVGGRVTVFLKDVDVWEAFETILLENDLAYEENGAIISVITAKDYELRHGARFKEQTDTRVFNLNYAHADKLSGKLQDSVTKGVGSVQVDERTNKIAVTDYPDKLDRMAGLIAAFDEKTPQVLIDAQIIEINPSDKFTMGVDWDYWLKKNLRLASSMPTANVANKLSIGTAAAGNLVSKDGQYKGIIDLLRTIGDTKILSSPRIMAMNNQEARIMVGTKEAYITSTVSQGGTGTAVTAQNVNFVDVGIKLYVTPTINSEGFVMMKIRPEISSAERLDILSNGQSTEIPIVTSSEAETEVTVKDGVTILIGGLRKDQRAKTVKKIPLLGDVPLVGFLFRNTSDDTSKSELVILLTPHLMSGENSYTDFAEVPPRQGAVASMVNGNIITEKFPRTTYKQAFYDKYRQQIIAKIEQAIKRIDSKGIHGKVSLVLNVGSNGLLNSDPEVLETADASLIELAGRTVMTALPFPPLPKELGKSQEKIQVDVAY
jgi:MSHA type pilus biogenesis protein MshL